MTEFAHNGTSISFTDDGTFLAMVNGRRVRKQSLKAMKDHIDNAAKKVFDKMTVLTDQDWRSKEGVIKGTHLRRVTVTSVEKKGYGRFDKNKLEFQSASGEGYRQCYRDCPETIAAVKALAKYQEETRRIDESRREEAYRLKKLLESFALDPNEYAPKK